MNKLLKKLSQIESIIIIEKNIIIWIVYTIIYWIVN